MFGSHVLYTMGVSYRRWLSNEEHAEAAAPSQLILALGKNQTSFWFWDVPPQGFGGFNPFPNNDFDVGHHFGITVAISRTTR